MAFASERLHASLDTVVIEEGIHPLEIKLGVLQVRAQTTSIFIYLFWNLKLQLTDALSYLHNSAHILHGNITPGAVFVTSTRLWKLGGFAFSVGAKEAVRDSNDDDYRQAVSSYRMGIRDIHGPRNCPQPFNPISISWHRNISNRTLTGLPPQQMSFRSVFSSAGSMLVCFYLLVYCLFVCLLPNAYINMNIHWRRIQICI